jgi:hypothetical protein
MKTKLFLVALLFSVCGALFAQDTQAIEFEERVHDFGTINEVDGRVSFDFEFKNISNKPVTLTNVQASCGCTTPNWPKEPIAPGKKSYITATYNPAGRPGNFNKSITIRYLKAGDEKSSALILNIKGSVTPKPQAQQ